jgi:hypothetical protein
MKARCGARTRTPDHHPCQISPVKGRDRCKYHGGKTLVGAANGQYVSGRYSKFLPERMAVKYREAEQDPHLLSLHSEVALVDARLVELLKRVDTGESGQLWDELQEEWKELRQHSAAQALAKMRLSIGRLDSIMSRAIQDHLAWQEISEKLEQRRKLVESEQKRLVAMRLMITQEQALLLMGAVTDVITRNVPDKQVLSQIVVELQQIMTRDQVPVYAEIAE